MRKIKLIQQRSQEPEERVLGEDSELGEAVR